MSKLDWQIVQVEDKWEIRFLRVDAYIAWEHKRTKSGRQLKKKVPKAIPVRNWLKSQFPVLKDIELVWDDSYEADAPHIDIVDSWDTYEEAKAFLDKVIGNKKAQDEKE